MNIAEAVASLKKELGTFINIMNEAPGIEEYRREMAELQALDRKCDALLAGTAKQEQMHQAEMALTKQGDAARAVVDEAAAAKDKLAAAKPPPFFKKGQALDPAEMEPVIRRLLDSATEATSALRQSDAIKDFSAEYGPSHEDLRPVAAVPTDGYAEPDIEETPAPVIAALLQLARIQASDILYNLGCGDGRLLISAASKHGARGVGIDANAAAVEVARENLRKTRLTRLVTIDAGNPLTVDVSSATTVFLALGAKQNSEMKELLLRQLHGGARIVTHQGGLPGWPPQEEKVVRDEEGRSYRLRLWRAPGRESGPGSSIGNLSESDWESRAE